MKAFACAFLALVFVARVAGAAEPSGWRSDVPCGHRLPVEKIEARGCERAVAVRLPEGGEFSVCQTSQSMETAEMRARLRRNSETIKEWNVMVVPPVRLDSDRLGDSGFPVRVDALDMNGDGKEEFLIAVMNNEGQGMGVTSWSIWLFDGTRLSPPLEAADYGALSFPVCSQDGRQKFLLAGQWQEGWEPGRGKGLYFSACWFQLYMDYDSWLPADRPSIYRRYLFGFERTRGQAMESENPLPWYRSSHTHILVGPWTCSGK